MQKNYHITQLHFFVLWTKAVGVDGRSDSGCCTSSNRSARPPSSKRRTFKVIRFPSSTVETSNSSRRVRGPNEGDVGQQKQASHRFFPSVKTAQTLFGGIKGSNFTIWTTHPPIPPTLFDWALQSCGNAVSIEFRLSGVRDRGLMGACGGRLEEVEMEFGKGDEDA